MEPQPDKRELYQRIWNRHAQVDIPPSVILDDIVETCRQQGPDFNDVLTIAIIASNLDTAADPTDGG